MNKVRRKAIGEVAEKLFEARLLLEEIKDEEEEYKDNMPENLWGSERYEKAEEAVDLMDEIICNLEDAESTLEEICE